MRRCSTVGSMTRIWRSRSEGRPDDGDGDQGRWVSGRMRLDSALAGAGATSDVETEGGQGRASPFVITSQVLQQPDWTPQVVSSRQKSAVDTLRKLWACCNRSGVVPSAPYATAQVYSVAEEKTSVLSSAILASWIS